MDQGGYPFARGLFLTPIPKVRPYRLQAYLKFSGVSILTAENLDFPDLDDKVKSQ
jgi:hypothetical protein